MATGKTLIEATARANGWELSGTDYDRYYRRNRAWIQVAYDTRGRVVYAATGAEAYYDRDKAARVIEILKGAGQ